MDQLLKIISNYLDRPDLLAVLFLLILLFLLALLILWLILPFAIFGTKKKLNEIIKNRQETVILFGRLVVQNRKINTLLSEIMTESKRTTAQLSKMNSDMKPVEEPVIHENTSEIAPGEPETDDTSEPNTDDRRMHPRLEFYCDGKIMGKAAVIRDISMGGLFIELDEIPELLKVGQVTNIDLNLPTENETVRLKIKIASQNDRGAGCKFIDLTPENQQAIEYCFYEFGDTLPISDLEKEVEIVTDKMISKDDVAPYSGNTSVKVFHKMGCRYYDCKNCTASFSSREEAVSAGYQPCGICNP